MTWNDGATFAVAAATLVLAFFTWRAARAAVEASKAANDAAQAGRDEADATTDLARQAREDRELAWRPHLGIEVPTYSNGPGQDLVTAVITNVGNGPAIDCAFWTYRGEMEAAVYRWGQSSGFQLAASQTKPLDPVPRDPAGVAPVFPEGLFDPPEGGSHGSHVVYVVTCTDLLGNTWRFVQGHRPEMVRADDPSPPRWMKYL